MVRRNFLEDPGVLPRHGVQGVDAGAQPGIAGAQQDLFPEVLRRARTEQESGAPVGWPDRPAAGLAGDDRLRAVARNRSPVPLSRAGAARA